MTLSLLHTATGYALDMDFGSYVLLWFLLVSVAAVVAAGRAK